VPTDHLSLANAAPVLYPFFNNGPVFGLPGTVTGGFWERTQITGDWGGRRTDLARRGVFFDVYTTSAYQDIMSGGLEPGDWFVQNTQMSINIDTGRAGLWDGGLIHFATQARYGANPAQTFNSGASVPMSRCSARWISAAPAPARRTPPAISPTRWNWDTPTRSNTSSSAWATSRT
jgi:hypothetical protein